MIRKAKENDILYIIETGHRLHERSGNEDVPIHRPTVFHTLRQFIHHPDKCAIVSEHENVIRGFLLGCAIPFWWDDHDRGRRYATDYAFYSEHRGDGLLMLEAFKEWAWKVPRVVEVACATNVPKGRGVVGALYKRAGFEQVGGMYRVKKP